MSRSCNVMKYASRLMVVIMLIVVYFALEPSPFSYATGEVGSTLKTTVRTLEPGDVYTLDNHTDSVKVVINKSGDYYLGGSSNKTHISISAGGDGGKVTVHLYDGLSVTPGALANIGKTVAGITIEDDGGTVELMSAPNANVLIKGYMMSPAILKNGKNTKLVFSTEDTSRPGTIVAKAAGDVVASPGIGGTCYGLKKGCKVPSGNIYFESGTVEAHGTNAAGIGSGTRKVGKLVFNGGTIRSYGTGKGAGIGGTDTCSVDTITINGGDITAISEKAAGIGGGKDSRFSDNVIKCITINGGTIYAESKGGCAGIGSGSDCSAQMIVINGGKITAKTSGVIDLTITKAYGGCGIGGTGRWYNSSRSPNIVITGGEITASSSCKHGCGIGCGDVSKGTNNITITGGIINASGAEDGYAIGGIGRLGHPATLNVNISGGTIYPEDNGKPAIGTFGKSSDLKIKITGGSLYADNALGSTPVNDDGEELVMSYIGFNLLDEGTRVNFLGITHNGKDYSYGCNDVYTRIYGQAPNSKKSYVYAWLPEEDTTIISKAKVTLSGNMKNFYGKISSLDRSPSGKGAIVGELSQAQQVTIKKPFDDCGEDGSVYCGFLWDEGDDLTAPGIKEGYTITGYSFMDGSKRKEIMSVDGSFKPSVYCDADHCTYTDAAGKWYASWKSNMEFLTDYRPNKYTVKYDCNVPDNATTKISGVINMADYTIDGSKKTIDAVSGIKYDEEFNISTEGFMLSGYAFAGWNTKKDGSGTHYNSNQAVKSLTAEDGGVVTLYAEWKPLEYQIEFDKGEGIGETVSGTMANEIMQFDTSKALSKLNYSNNKRQAFAGWKRTGAGTKMYADEAKVENLVGDVNALDALWKDAYLAAGSSAFPTYEETKSRYTKPVINLTAQWLNAAKFTACVTLNDTPMENIPIQLRDRNNPSTIIGYFVTDAYGTASSDRGKGKLEDAESPINVPDGCYDVIVAGGQETGIIWDSSSGKQPGTIYLQYYNYRYDTSIDPNIHKDAFIIDVTGSQSQYKFPERTDGAALSPFAKSVYVLDEEHITLKDNNIKVFCPIDTASYVPYNTFNRWNSLGVDPDYVSGYSPTSNEAKISIQGETVFKAESRPVQYKVIFDGNGATSGNMEEISSCLYGISYSLPKSDFERKGYYFSGWSTSKDGNKEYDDEAEIKNLSTVEGATATLYAVWEPYDYSVDFDSNGADNEMESMLCKYGTKVQLTKCNLNYTDYTFLGWNTSPGSDEVIYKDGAETMNFSELPGFEITDGCEIKLYAVWTNEYKVVYDANGGSGEMYDEDGICGNTIVLGECEFTRAGYTFKEWNTKADGSGKAYNPEEEYDSIAKGGDTLTLYAIWTNNSTNTGDSNRLLLYTTLGLIAVLGLALLLRIRIRNGEING